MPEDNRLRFGLKFAMLQRHPGWRYINAWGVGADWCNQAAQQAGGLNSRQLVGVFLFAFWGEANYLYP